MMTATRELFTPEMLPRNVGDADLRENGRF
jgi:hypothetical protein